MIYSIPGEKGSPTSGKPRLLLDTNVWRYVVDHDAQARLLQLARDGLYDVQIAPSVLYETLRFKDSSLRASLVKVMTNPRFRRLMPEAYSESMEILREIKRVSPHWLRKQPDLRWFDRQRKDWSRKTATNGFWERCARSPESEAGYIQKGEGNLLERAETQARNARTEMLTGEWKRPPPLNDLVAAFPNPVHGWRGDDIEAWRVDSMTGISNSLSQNNNPYYEWMSPFVAFETLLYSTEWNDFWFYRADKNFLPRQWLRRAHSFIQRFRKVTAGSAGDTQLYTYFVETDVVATADKALIGILDECRPYAPCRLPEGALLPGDKAGVTKLFDILETKPMM